MPTKLTCRILAALTLAVAGCATAAPAQPTAAPTPTSAPPVESSGPQAAASPALAASPLASPAAPAASPAAPAASPAAAVPSPSAAPAAATGPLQKLSIAYSAASASGLPTFIAQEAGIFRQNGLDTSVQLINSAPNTLAALLSNQVDVAEIGGVEVLNSAAGGADVVVLGTQMPYYPYLFMVPASIASADQLKGKAIAVNSRGSADYVASRVVLRRLGLDPDKDVTIVPSGSSTNSVGAVASGQAGGASLQPDASRALEGQGFHALVDLGAEHLPTANFCVVVRKSWLAGHGDVARKLMDSVLQATVREKRDRALAIDVLKKYLQSDNEASLNATYDYYVKVLPDVPYARPDQFAEAASELTSTNPAVAKLDVASLIDSSFLDDAVKRGVDKSAS